MKLNSSSITIIKIERVAKGKIKMKSEKESKRWEESMIKNSIKSRLTVYKSNKNKEIKQSKRKVKKTQTPPNQKWVQKYFCVSG